MYRRKLGSRFVIDGVTTVLDAGRWCQPSPVDPLLAAADVVLVVTNSDVEQVRQCRERLCRIRQLAADVRLVVVGRREQRTPQEVVQALEVPLAGFVPWDVRGADVLAGRAAPYRGWGAGGWKRLPLLRACRRIGHLLQASRMPSPEAPAELPRDRNWARAAYGR